MVLEPKATLGKSMFPKKAQWKSWKLPTKYTAIGLAVGVASLLLTMLGLYLAETEENIPVIPSGTDLEAYMTPEQIKQYRLVPYLTEDSTAYQLLQLQLGRYEYGRCGTADQRFSKQECSEIALDLERLYQKGITLYEESLHLMDTDTKKTHCIFLHNRVLIMAQAGFSVAVSPDC